MKLKYIKVIKRKNYWYIYPKKKHTLSGLELPRENKYLGRIFLRQESSSPFWNQEPRLDISMELVKEIGLIMEEYYNWKKNE